ncbi:MAG: phosphatidylglycerol lysyltransferase domain-containing protein [Chloroflexota bacterium]|nr:bifunctional lysylphosphatidylglycerol flippase/synthetase MprF [Chloroflexota bacterium]MBI5703827.1 bifunctional lysylphosphatidylglycerol flippase/synthetase MprF [Chloroflexota bacterium]
MSLKRRFSLSDRNLVHVIAALTAVMGMVNVFSAITPALHERLRLLEKYLPLQVIHGGHLVSALAGFALLLLSVNLWRRKQVAWWLTLATLGLSIPVHLFKGLDYEETVLSAFVLTCLLLTRKHFHARSDLPSMRQGLLTLLAAFGFTLIYGVLGFYLLDRHYSVKFGFWGALRQTVIMFVEFYDPGIQPVTGFGRYFADSIYLVGAVTMGYALLMFLRPVLNHRLPSDAERARAWTIVNTFGRTPLARYALLDDKNLFFSVNGSLISYVTASRVALALGDPIGPPQDLAAAISQFKDFCAPNDWLPAFYQVTPTYLETYKSAGFNVLAIGNEAVVELSAFTLEGSENKPLRNSYNKLVRLGYRADVIQPPFSPRMMMELESISNEWLSARGTSEMRFSLGWFNEAYLQTGPILLVRDREGFIEAFANIVSVGQTREAAVDLMRHRQHVESGLMDFLFVSLLQWARENNFSAFNLGLSALSGVGEHSDNPVIERAMRYIYKNVNRLYNFQGLHTFKEKFHPIWSPRYLVYPPASLPAVGAALWRVHQGRGLITSLVRSR